MEDIPHDTTAGGVLKSVLSENPMIPNGLGKSFGSLKSSQSFTNLTTEYFLRRYTISSYQPVIF